MININKITNSTYKLSGWDIFAFGIYQITFTSIFDAYFYCEKSILYYLILIIILVISGLYFIISFYKKNGGD